MEKDNKNLQQPATIDDVLLAIKDGFNGMQKQLNEVKHNFSMTKISFDMVKFDVSVLRCEMRNFRDRFDSFVGKTAGNDKAQIPDTQEPIDFGNRMNFLEGKVDAVEMAIRDIKRALGLDKD